MITLDADWLAAHPLPDPGEHTDKNARGRLLVAGGSLAVPGALRLTSEAGLRAGAGKSRMATVAPAALGLGLAMPEAAAFPLPANDAGELAGDAAVEICRLAKLCDALVVGPGMGTRADAASIAASLLKSAIAVPMLLDAAMLHVCGDLADDLARFEGSLVLTPHPGEMASLMGCDADEIGPEVATNAARRFDATIVLKSSETWVAAPDGTMLHYPGGGPGLATGGSGDVLAGVIGGLLARGAPPLVASGWGVWLHGEAGRRLAQQVGRLGFLARELLPLIPALMDSHHPAARQEAASAELPDNDRVVR